MQTTAKKPAQKQKPNSNSLTLPLYKHLRKQYPNQPGRLAVKFLWQEGDIHNFRANWWGEAGIILSKFLKVKEGPGGELQVLQ